MKAKIYKIWLFALVGALALSLFGAAITYGRYGSNPSISEDSLYGDIIDFIGAEKYVVRTPEELTAAIENGYSYIEIAEDAEQPFEVTTGVTDVEANLVIDINGNDVIRNSRNPLLNVQENVSVVIVFDSESNTATEGSFYNPVGSSLQVAGGTLTIAAGTYDCGPREGERVELSGSNYITEGGGKFAETSATQEVTLHVRNGYGTNGDYSSTNLRQTGYTTATANMPVITPNTDGGKVNGNMYFADGSLQGTAQGYNTYIKGDTFLVYGVSDVADPQPLCDAASCDFYYSYPIGDDNYNYNADGTRYAVVYGYNDVMDGATAQISATDTSGGEVTSQVVWPYAAIRMESGEAFARGGNYENHFGTANSYGIYAEGGNLVVSGTSAFTAIEDGVCIHCEESSAGAANLVVTGGTFASERGDTVQVEGGILYASGGTFTKSASAESGNSAIVRMTGGTFTGPASGSSRITMTAGASNNVLDRVFGVYSVGGTVNLYRADITLHGTYGAGVLATASAEASASAPSVTMHNCNVTVANSTYADWVDYTYSQFLTSTAVSSQGGNITFTGNNTIASDSLGITAAGGSSRAGEQVVVQSGTTSVTTTHGTGVYVYGGSLAVNEEATLTVNATVTPSGNGIEPAYSWSQTQGVAATTRVDGIAIDGGSLRADGALNVTFTGLQNGPQTSSTFDQLTTTSYAVRVQAGGAGNAANVTIAGGEITAVTGGGVYVSDGTVNLGVDDGTPAGPTVTTQGKNLHSGYRQDLSGTSGSNWNYRVSQNGGPAIEVAGGSLYVNGGSYSSAQGDGILVRNGSANIYNGTFSGKDIYWAQNSTTGFVAGPGASYAFKLYGGTANVYGGRFESFGAVDADGNLTEPGGNGAFVMEGEANVYGGIFSCNGASGFSVWRNATLIFGDETKSEEVNNANLIVAAASTGIAVENQSINANNAAEITIHGGIFSGGTYSNTEQSVYITGDGGGRNGIWYGTSWSKVTISGGQFIGDNSGFDYDGSAGAHVKGNVTISGGTFTGERTNEEDLNDWRNRYYKAAGLRFNTNQWASDGGVVVISGGTFKGVPHRSGSHYLYGAIGTNDDGLGEDIQLLDIIEKGYDDTTRNVEYTYSDGTTGTWTYEQLREWEYNAELPWPYTSRDCPLRDTTAECTQVRVY